MIKRQLQQLINGEWVDINKKKYKIKEEKNAVISISFPEADLVKGNYRIKDKKGIIKFN